MFIFGAIRFAISFVIIFFLLSIHINNTTIFDHIAKHTEPAKQQAWSVTKNVFAKSFSAFSEFGKKLISNSEPILNESSQDRVSSKKSAIKHNKKTSPRLREEVLDYVQDEDVKKLDDFLRSQE